MIKKTQWNAQGDHKAVQSYGDSVVDQYPLYARCGFITLNGDNLHVRPSFWIIEHIVDNRLIDIQIKPDGEQ